MVEDLRDRATAEPLTGGSSSLTFVAQACAG
jgi:hypothetical protein